MNQVAQISYPMHTLREILMIDDNFQKWHPFLSGTASERGFNITNAPSVEEGLEKLRSYSGSIEAVILGLSFKEGKMQGKEGLLKIKEIDPCLPVIIFTARNDSFPFVAECIRLGAYDYFVKPKFDPAHLFLQVETAIQQSLQKRRFTFLNQVSSETSIPRPCLYLSEDTAKVTYQGFFGYRLSHMIRLQNPDPIEKEYLNQLTVRWHLNLLTALSFHDQDVKLRLRYITHPSSKKTDIILLFEFAATSQETAALRFEEIRQEMDAFLQPKADYSKGHYFFQPVTEEGDLRDLLFPFSEEHAIQLMPGKVELKRVSRPKVGFSTESINSIEEVVALPQIMDSDSSMGNLLSLLSDQRTRTMLELVVQPVNLSKSEVDALRSIVMNHAAIGSTTGIETENALKSLSGYLQSPSKCFQVTVFASQENGVIKKNLLSAISTGFFGYLSSVEFAKVQTSTNTVVTGLPQPTHDTRWRNLYSISNILHVFKLPYPTSDELPGLASLFPVFGNIPKNISKTGPIAGTMNARGQKMQIRISTEDLRKHLYLLGQTGTGKTTVLQSMIMERIHAGKGICLIDPHGDLFQKVKENIPSHRKKDLICFEPGQFGNHIRINLLEYNKKIPQEKSFLINELFLFFRQEYVEESMGPMFEMFMKNALLLLMDDPDNLLTICEAPAIFQNEEFRSNLLDTCKDQEVVDFWRKTAPRLSGEFSLANWMPYITSKLNQLTMNDYIRPIISSPKSNINFREIIDNDTIFLISLSKGKIGKIGVNILGSVILSRIINAAYSRENIPEENRKDFILFVDEFQNFVSSSVMYAMSEARKYRLSLVLANQTMGQLDNVMRQSILGNVGSTMFFRPGINDVDYVMPYFTPHLTRENVLTLPNFKCIGRIQIENALSLPFIFDTIPPPKRETILPLGKNVKQ